MKAFADSGNRTCQVVYYLLSHCQVFQFHDTSDTAKIRSPGYKDDARFLRSDGGNLAAFLRGLRNREGEKDTTTASCATSDRCASIRGLRFGALARERQVCAAELAGKGSDYLFGPHQLSDGSLRFMALTTLFMQPPDLRPRVIIVDEPELGLHPAAISALAGMVQAAPPATQVILATQSTRLVDEFTTDQVMLVERDEKHPRTAFRRLNKQDLEEWLKRYCLSELWEKNVLGRNVPECRCDFTSSAEGQTEERFVKEVLSPFLSEQAVWADSRCVLTSKDKRGLC